MRSKTIFLSLFMLMFSTFVLCQDEIEVCGEEYIILVEIPEVGTYTLISEPAIYPEGWDTLSSIIFWRTAIQTPPEKCLVSLASNREILGDIPSSIYQKKRYRSQRRYFRDSLKTAWDIPDQESIYITQGRAHYYLIEEALPQIHESVPIFLEEGIDPWYAQAILLIESPGKIRKSRAGAYGPYQLMKTVGRQFGLSINKEVDERADLQKSARATARFLREVVIPNTIRLVERRGQPYIEESLWFKLLVLHVYHAGAGNVAGALRKIPYSVKENELIIQLWKTKSRRFRNASQNYSQIVLAAKLELEKLIYQKKGKLIPPYFFQSSR
ncbi:MAG: hypothetical protein AAF655_15525 [Bacteroidota bacterium]